jgi:hypothetical protein
MAGNINRIFNVGTNKLNVICPPDQVFIRRDFDFLLTIGGDLVTDEEEYEKFLGLLEKIGETEFYICENIGATSSERKTPFQAIVSTNDDFDTFKLKVGAFEPPFGWTTHHFFVFGLKENWGIYICEYPTINIIGCENELSDEFRQTFSINGNGFSDLKEFIGQEYQSIPNLMNDLIINYRFEKVQ